MIPRGASSAPIAAAMFCSGIVVGQFIAGKATRDALYLLHFDVTTLPTMVIVTSATSILLVIASSKVLRQLTPGAFVPLSFTVSAILLMGEWVLVHWAPRAAAVALYVHVSGLGPMLGSGFWLLLSERFDPRSAKVHFARIGGAGTLGGLAGGVLAERVASGFDIAVMLPILSGLNLLCAALAATLAAEAGTGPSQRRHPVEIAPELSPEAPRSGLRVLKEARYLRNLAALVLLGTAGSELMDYVFKVQAVATFGEADNLLRFFAIYYAAVSLVTFGVQTAWGRRVLAQAGLALGTATPSLALLGGSVAAIAVPGLTSAVVARGSEAVLRGSLFRASYEIFYIPIATAEKRAAKSLIDVGFDRLGDATGGTLVRLVLLLLPAYQHIAILSLAIGTAAAALVFASRLNRGYIQTLERSLLNRAVELDLSDVQDLTTRSVMARTLPGIRRPTKPGTTIYPTPGRRDPGPREPPGREERPAPTDPEVLQIAALRSRDRDQILRVLQSGRKLRPTLISHVIPLLAWDAVAAACLEALRAVADERAGELVDALLDPGQDFTVRRRLARVFAACRSQRAVDGALLGLNDHRFEVRFQVARSLAAIAQSNPQVRINRDFILEIVQRETAVGRPVWESHRLLIQLDDHEDHVFVDEFVKDRASRSLAHVFTLLSLVLPAEPLRIAFRGLHTDDPALRGTALEYLEGILPAEIRGRLWPFLEDHRTAAGQPGRPRDEILADLIRSHASIMLNLEELQRRAKGAAGKP
jgi:hypothetical protein